MPSFCRHNRLVQNCPICAREQHVEMRPVVSPGGRPAPEPRPARTASTSAGAGATRSGSAGRVSGRGTTGVTVRRLVREAADDYRCALVPGIKSGVDAARLAEELAFSVARLQWLASDPPGLYAEVADPAGDIEERTWLAFQIACLRPLDDADPFAAIAAARSSWASGEAPALEGTAVGPGGIADPARAARIVGAYRAWAQRAGSQAAAYAGDPSWTGARRFDRMFERLGSLAAMDRDLRYDLLVTLGCLGVYELRGESLHVGAPGPVTLAAKRILGIGDPLLLARRAGQLAEACGTPVEALDLGFFNWERGARYGGGLPADTAPDPTALDRARDALGLG